VKSREQYFVRISSQDTVVSLKAGLWISG